MLDSKLLDIIACPVCKGALYYKKGSNELICKFDNLAYPIIEGIPSLLIKNARNIKEKKKV
jgi:uncharacterized protein YbaR (Trm112 family)